MSVEKSFRQRRKQVVRSGKWFAVLLLAALLVTAAGCGGEMPEPEAGGDAGRELIPLNVGMAGKDIKTVFVILAKEKGFFEEEGLNVRFETVSTLNDGVTALTMDKLDILPYGFVPSAAFIAQGADVVIIGGTISEGSQAVVRAEDADMIQSLEDFRGKRVGFMRPETGQMIMKKLIQDAGVDIYTEVEFIPMDSFATIAEAIAKGEIDIGFVNSNYGYVAQQMGLAVAFDVGDYAPGAVCCRQTASAGTVAGKRAALVSFEVAVLRAYEVWKNNPEETISILVDYSGQDEDYVEAAMYNGVMLPSPDPELHRVSEMYDAMKQNGDIDVNTTVAIEDQVDISIYQDALQVMTEREPDNDLWKTLQAEFAAANL